MNIVNETRTGLTISATRETLKKYLVETKVNNPPKMELIAEIGPQFRFKMYYFFLLMQESIVPIYEKLESIEMSFEKNDRRGVFVFFFF